MTAPLSPVQTLLEVEKLLMTPLSTPRTDPHARAIEEFERRRKAADLAADLRIFLAQQESR